jgi:hypothetical protein
MNQCSQHCVRYLTLKSGLLRLTHLSNYQSGRAKIDTKNELNPLGIISVDRYTKMSYLILLIQYHHSYLERVLLLLKVRVKIILFAWITLTYYDIYTTLSICVYFNLYPYTMISMYTL